MKNTLLIGESFISSATSANFRLRERAGTLSSVTMQIAVRQLFQMRMKIGGKASLSAAEEKERNGIVAFNLREDRLNNTRTRTILFDICTFTYLYLNRCVCVCVYVAVVAIRRWNSRGTSGGLSKRKPRIKVGQVSFTDNRL